MKRILLPALFAAHGVTFAQDVIVRVGDCPVGYRTSSSYCISLDDERDEDSDETVVRVGDCPVGYRTSGSYCIKLD